MTSWLAILHLYAEWLTHWECSSVEYHCIHAIVCKIYVGKNVLDNMLETAQPWASRGREGVSCCLIS